MPDDKKDNTQTHIVLTKGTMILHYRVVERIGAGGMGEVYLAEDTKLDRKVALKFLSYQHSQNEELKARFMREAQAVAKLSHPNIVHIYEVGEYQNRPFFAMEHVEGQPLHNYIGEESLSISEILSIAVGICEGLNKAHQLGIVHRDIKTSNIVLDSDGHPKILDFGLATITGTEKITKEGSTIGTVAYMSPERARGNKADHRSDLFSFGIVLYEMICGRTPFRRETEAATLSAIAQDSAEPLARYKSSVTEGVQKIVDKLLEKDPKTRYQSAAGVVADLTKERRFLDSASYSPTPHSVAPIKSKSSKTKLILSGSAVLIIVILLLVLKPWNISISSGDEAVAAENRLAIMYFDNIVDPSDSARTGEIVTNLLITDLSESEHLRVVSSQRMYDILKQLGKEESHSIDRQTATQVASIAGAKWMMTGTILQMEPNVVITTQIIDVKSGQVEASQRSTSTKDEDIFSQIDKLSADIRNDLSVPGLSGEKSDKSLIEVTTKSPEAYRYYLEGVDFSRKLYRSPAEERFLKAIELDSTFAMAYYRLAELMWQIGRPEADEYIRKAVKYSDNASRPDRLHILAMSDGMAGDVEGAMSTLNQIIEEFPDDKLSYRRLANIYIDFKGEADKAISYLEKALELDPHDKVLYNTLAYSYKDLREYDKAIEALDRYVELVPNEPNPYDSKGEIYASEGKFDLAVESYLKALEKNPDFINAEIPLVFIYNDLGEFDKADERARKIVNCKYEKLRMFGRLVYSYSLLYKGKFNSALKRLSDGIAADKEEGPSGFLSGFEHAGKFVFRGYILNVIGQPEKGLEEIKEGRRILLQYNPETPLPFTGEYAVTLALLNKTEQAIALLDDARPVVENKSDRFAEALLYLAYGRIELLRENYPKAIEYIEKSIPINKRSVRPRAEYYLAIAYIKIGQPEKAIPLLERYTATLESYQINIPIERVLGYYYLGEAYELDGEIKKAVSSYEKFLDYWDNPDTELEQIKDAKKRLANLKS